MFRPPEAHITAKKLLKILGIRDGDLGDRVLVAGSPERIEQAKTLLENPVKVFQGFGQVAYRGSYDGQTVTIATGGRFAPEAAICAEKYIAQGAGNIIRVGSAGAVSKKIRPGELVIVTGAVTGESTSLNYIPEGYPALSSPVLVMKLVEEAEKLKIPYHLGIVWTTDYFLGETEEFRQTLDELNVLAVDMATSPLLVLSSIMAARAAAILAISDNLETGEFAFTKKEFQEAESNALKIALNVLAGLSKKK